MIEYVRYRIPVDRAADFAAAYRAAGQILAGSSHCLGHEVTRCVEEPERWVVRIRWDSITGHLQGFRGSAQFATFLAHVNPFLTMIEEMQHYEVVQPA